MNIIMSTTECWKNGTEKTNADGSCTCKPNWYGPRCKQECASNEKFITGYGCACQDGKAGLYCESSCNITGTINDAKIIKQGDKWINYWDIYSDGKPYCKCKTGYVGNDCQYKLDSNFNPTIHGYNIYNGQLNQYCTNGKVYPECTTCAQGYYATGSGCARILYNNNTCTCGNDNLGNCLICGQTNINNL
jgi:hypothetical protein